MHSNRICFFSGDITPPLGHPLCAGWYPPAKAITERLSANGVVIFPADAPPIVLCALDWAELGNDSHEEWTNSLALAAGTSADRVAVHCVHNHDAPWPDSGAQEILDAHGLLGEIMDRAWHAECLARTHASVREAAEKGGEVITHVRAGRAKVQGIASNRRLMGADGRVAGIRWTRCRNKLLRDEPEGVIDPFLKTISFWNQGRKLVSLHYYAVHPTSYDGGGAVTNEFVGIARDRISTQEGVPHLYFTECAGDITAGKYNDGVTNNRELFASKIFDAMSESERAAVEFSVREIFWKSSAVVLPWADIYSSEELEARFNPSASDLKAKLRAALSLNTRRRIELGKRIFVSALHLDDLAIAVHLPGEAFIAYQLFAQRLKPDALVAAPAYGDCGPGYIPLAASFAEGGYEPTDAFCSPDSERILKDAIREVFTKV